VRLASFGGPGFGLRAAGVTPEPGLPSYWDFFEDPARAAYNPKPKPPTRPASTEGIAKARRHFETFTASDAKFIRWLKPWV